MSAPPNQAASAVKPHIAKTVGAKREREHLMSSIVEDVVTEVLKFIFAVVMAWFLFWTGEAIITILLVGFHRPRWGGYSGTGALKWAFSETALFIIGFAFWLWFFPLAYKYFT
jgi:hypothetical protein